MANFLLGVEVGRGVDAPVVSRLLLSHRDLELGKLCLKFLQLRLLFRVRFGHAEVCLCPFHLRRPKRPLNLDCRCRLG